MNELISLSSDLASVSRSLPLVSLPLHSLYYYIVPFTIPTMHFKLPFLVFSGLATITSAESNFLASCSGVSGDGSSQSRIWSCCPSRPGGILMFTLLDLNNCLLNNNGNLGWLPNGGYLGSCGGCHLEGTRYVCSCRNSAGGTQTTSVELVSRADAPFIMRESDDDLLANVQIIT